MRKPPLVDVVMPTYNHERFVAQAIESALSQKTDFEYRLIIGDDCSTDQTQAIIRSYAEKYPERIETLLSTEHVGALHRDRVAVKLFRRCTAKYMAVLEGDDFWTDDLKLQKQVDFLESHPECSLCFHDALVFYENGSEAPHRLCPSDQKEISTLEDIVARNLLIPCTVMFRNNLLGELPDCFYEVRNADWMTYVLLAEHGNLGYIPEVMATYRVHGGGIWSQLNFPERIKEHIKTYEAIDAHLDFRYHHIVSEKIAELRVKLSQQYKQLARTCLDEYHNLARRGQFSNALPMLMQAIRQAPSEVFRPRRLAAILKNGLSAIIYSNNNKAQS